MGLTLALPQWPLIPFQLLRDPSLLQGQKQGVIRATGRVQAGLTAPHQDCKLGPGEDGPFSPKQLDVQGFSGKAEGPPVLALSLGHLG